MKKIVSFMVVNNLNIDYIENQAIIIAKFIKKNNLNLVKNIEHDINFINEDIDINLLISQIEKSEVKSLVVSDLHIFGRDIKIIVSNIKKIIKTGISVKIVNQKFDLIDNDMLTKVIFEVMQATAKLKTNLWSLKTKELLQHKKENGQVLGKPKGVIQKSKFDKNKNKIIELLGIGLSVRKIAKFLGYSNHIGLNNYINKKKLK